MLPFVNRLLRRSLRPFLAWCLLIAVPVAGVSGTLVGLLGAKHLHRAPAVSLSVDDADPMKGWVDMRRSSVGTHTARSSHTHDAFERHHHDHGDESVIAVDGGPLQTDASGDAGSSAGSLANVFAVNQANVSPVPTHLRFFWPEAAPAAALRWMADGPSRPPKS